MKINEDVIVEMLEAVSFYTEIGNATSVYVAYKDDRGIEQFTKSTDAEFQAFLRHTYRMNANVLIAPPLESYIKAYEDDAIVRKYETGITVHRRVCGDLSNRIVYYLSNDLSQIVVVSPKGWRVGRSSKYHFIKQPFDLPQVTPIGGGNLLMLASGVPNHILSGITNHFLSENWEPINEFLDCQQPRLANCLFLRCHRLNSLNLASLH